MEPERWQQVERLYHAALEHDPSERGAYLQKECGGDEALLGELEELLAYEKRSADFIEAPALEVAARQDASELFGRVHDVLQSALEQPGRAPFRLASGEKLGPYEILDTLGAGGMGEIYRARDSRLGRIVALKILAARMMDQGGNRVRFEREARAISSLNHPNICILYDIGRDGEIDYLVMEYVEGQTLAERLKRGALPVPELLRIAIEISEALDYAHRCGVIHRDLKPGNIMLTGRGAKLVDFGLARWREEAGEIAASVLLDGDRSLTMTGMVLGTPQYMAPEQIERGEVSRTDVFALGAVIFEMAAGRKAFQGSTHIEIVDAIRAGEPIGLQNLQPAALRGVVGRCLKKAPAERWQSAGDLAEELRRIERGGTRRTRSKVREWVAGVAAMAILGLGAWAMRAINHRGAALTDQVLYSFTGANGDGARPGASVVASRGGVLYGTTWRGGTAGKGTVFELRPPAASGSAWTETILHTFLGEGGPFGPLASLLVGERGVLYGTTSEGNGSVFELTPPPNPGGRWTQRILHSFSGQNGDGAVPRAGLAMGRNGALYGTTLYGGAPQEDGYGTVFELIPPAASGGNWKENVIYRMPAGIGARAHPYADVVFGADGALYGTLFGGHPGPGGVFKLTPPAQPDGTWTEQELHRFTGQQGDGASPVSGLTFGKSGALYGTTQWGGKSNNGTVFELTPPETAGGHWTYSVLYQFTSHIGDGAEPTAGLVAGDDGTLYGVAMKGGAWGNGAVYKLTRASGPWIETVLYSFTGHDGDGAIPGCLGRLLLVGSALYGTTELGGASNAGTVFKLPITDRSARWNRSE